MTSSVVYQSESLAADPEELGSIPGATWFLRSSGSGIESTQPREENWGATWMKSSGSGLENPYCADHVALSTRKSRHYFTGCGGPQSVYSLKD
jgi:hypothetical protein